MKKEQVDFEKDMSLNMGQILSIPAVLFGIGILIIGYYNKNKKAKNLSVPLKENDKIA